MTADPNPLFRWIYRLLALGALLALVVGAFTIASAWWRGRAWMQRQHVEVAVDDQQATPRALRFHDLQALAGTGTKVLRVGEVAQGDGLGSGSGSGLYDGSVDRNLVFLRDGMQTATWLFRGNMQALGRVDAVCAAAAERCERVVALYLEVATRDTNGDDAVDRQDAMRPALVRTDGSGYTLLGSASARVLDQVVAADASTVGLLLQEGRWLVYREYSTTTFRTIREQRITQLR